MMASCFTKGIPTALLWVVAVSAQADIRDRLAACASEPSDLARLICYDTLARDMDQQQPHLREDPTYTPPPRPAARQAPPAVRVHTQGSRHRLVIAARQDEREGRVVFTPMAGPEARLVLGCAERSLSAFVDWDRGMGRGTAALRLDWDEGRRETVMADVVPVDINGEHLTDSATSFRNPAPLLRGLEQHVLLEVRARDEAENSLLAVFDLAPAQAGIRDLARHCGLDD